MGIVSIFGLAASVAMVCLKRPPGHRLITRLSLVIAAGALLDLLQRGLGVLQLHQSHPLEWAAVLIALLILLSALRILLVSLEAGRHESSPVAASADTHSNRLLPSVLLINIATGCLCAFVAAAHVVPATTAWALYIVCSVLASLLLFWRMSGIHRQHLRQSASRSMASPHAALLQRTVIENNQLLVFVCDALGSILSASNATERKLGFAPGGLVGTAIAEIIPDTAELKTHTAAGTGPAARPIFPGLGTSLADTVSTGGGLEVWQCRRANGSRFHARFLVAPVAGGGPDTGGFLVIGLDVSECNLPDAVATGELTSLDARTRDVLEFAFVAAHDLQEPLRKIRLFSDRVLTELSSSMSDRARDYLTRNIQAAERMQALISSLTEYSGVSARSGEFVRIDLNELIATVVDDLAAKIDRSGGQVTWTDLPEIPGREVQLRQLFQNLLTNALKFRHPDRNPVVRISAEPMRGVNGPEWAIHIADNGIGFESTDAEVIFSPFKRLHGRTAYGGTGIGLAIVRRVVEFHRGRISARANPGEGAVFTVTFPAPAADG